MSTICPSCNKFAGLDLEDEGEEQDLSVAPNETFEGEDSESGKPETTFTVTAEFVIRRNSACCGDEMKTATFNMEAEGTLVHKEDCESHDDLNVQVGDNETYESGGGRYAKNMIGLRITAEVTCGECGETAEVEMTDEIAAGAMDESN